MTALSELQSATFNRWNPHISSGTFPERSCACIFLMMFFTYICFLYERIMFVSCSGLCNTAGLRNYNLPEALFGLTHISDVWMHLFWPNVNAGMKNPQKSSLIIFSKFCVDCCSILGKWASLLNIPCQGAGQRSRLIPARCWGMHHPGRPNPSGLRALLSDFGVAGERVIHQSALIGIMGGWTNSLGSYWPAMTSNLVSNAVRHPWERAN